MATRLVEDMSDSWKREHCKDTYHEDFMRLIRKRIKAGRTEVIAAPHDEEPAAKPSTGKVLDLMALFKKSVQRTGTHNRTSISQEGRSGREVHNR